MFVVDQRFQRAGRSEPLRSAMREVCSCTIQELVTIPEPRDLETIPFPAWNVCIESTMEALLYQRLDELLDFAGGWRRSSSLNGAVASW